MQLNLQTNLALFIILCLSGCATSAPDLPDDYSSINSNRVIEKSMFTNKYLSKTCDDIVIENTSLTQVLVDIDKKIMTVVLAIRL